MDQPSMVANPARGQPEILVSREGFGIPVPRQPGHLHTLADSGAYLGIVPAPLPLLGHTAG